MISRRSFLSSLAAVPLLGRLIPAAPRESMLPVELPAGFLHYTPPWSFDVGCTQAHRLGDEYGWDRGWVPGTLTYRASFGGETIARVGGLVSDSPPGRYPGRGDFADVLPARPDSPMGLLPSLAVTTPNYGFINLDGDYNRLYAGSATVDVDPTSPCSAWAALVLCRAWQYGDVRPGVEELMMLRADPYGKVVAGLAGELAWREAGFAEAVPEACSVEPVPEFLGVALNYAKLALGGAKES